MQTASPWNLLSKLSRQQTPAETFHSLDVSALILERRPCGLVLLLRNVRILSVFLVIKVSTTRLRTHADKLQKEHFVCVLACSRDLTSFLLRLQYHHLQEELAEPKPLPPCPHLLFLALSCPSPMERER